MRHQVTIGSKIETTHDRNTITYERGIYFRQESNSHQHRTTSTLQMYSGASWQTKDVPDKFPESGRAWGTPSPDPFRKLI